MLLSIHPDPTIWKDLLNNLPGMFCRWSPGIERSFVNVSSGCLQLTGYPEDELQGKPAIHYSDLIYPDDRDSANRLCRDQLKKKQLINHSYRIITKTGEVKWVHDISKGIYDKDGQLLYIEGYITDITEKKTYQEIIETLQAYERATKEGAIVSITDAKGRIIYANDKFCEVSKYPREELTGETYECLNSGLHPESFFKDMWKEISSGKTWKGTIGNKARDGRYYWVDTVITPVFNEKKEVFQYLSVQNLVSTPIEGQEKLISIRSAIDSSPDLIFLIDPEKFTFIDVNKQALQDMGLTKDELFKHGPEYKNLPWKKAELEKAFEKLLHKESELEVLESGYINRFGKMVDAELQLKLHLLGDQKIMVASARDITEKKKARQELKQSRQFIQSILSGLSSSIAAINGKGEIIFVNESWKQFAESNEAAYPLVSEGVNYLEVCRKAYEQGDSLAGKAMEGIVSVMKRKKHLYEMEYPCHSPSAARWFNMRVTPLEAVEDGVIISHHDITEKKLAEERIRESEEKFRDIVENTNDFIVSVDSNANILYVNESWKRTLGYKGHDMKGESIFRFIHPESLEYCKRLYEQLLEGRETRYIELDFIDKDGKRITCQANINPVYKNGKLDLVKGIVRDITRSKTYERELRNREQQLKDAQRIAKLGSWHYEIKENKVDWSEETYSIFGVEPGTEMTIEGFMDCVHPDDKELVWQAWTAALTGAPYDIEHRIKLGDRVSWVREMAKIEFDEQGHPVSGIGITQDITERKNFDLILFNSIIDSGEKEQNRIALELHDGVCQYMAAAKLTVERVIKAVERKEWPSPVVLTHAKKVIQEAIDLARNISHELMPITLYESGLQHALEDLISNLNKTGGIRYELMVKGTERQIESHLATNLFRIAQEFIRNSERHSGATNVSLTLVYRKNDVEMLATDNGKGFNFHETEMQKGIGLVGMIRRIESIGGSYKYDAAPGKGVSLWIQAPYIK